MKVRAWLAGIIAFVGIFMLVVVSAAWGEKNIRGVQGIKGIRIVAEDSSSKEWVDIPLYNKTYAVVIGIDRYSALKQDQQLSYAVSDAKAVENLLKSKFIFDDVFTLYNEQATKSKILDLLLNKLSKTSNNDAVFVFFAGHGGEEETNYGPIGFLVPYDGDFSDMRTVISMATIRDDISKRIKAKHVFYVMDACYSGILVATRGDEKKNRRDVAYLQQIAKEPVRQVLTAGGADQQVLDGGPGGHSVFTGRFLEVLDKADDFITATEVSSQVKERVFSDAKARGHVQTPKSGELFGLGDFIFMPSVTKQIGSIKDQVTTLESELALLKEAEAKAVQNQDDAARRDIERQTRIAEAKLQAKKLEEDRLKKDEIQRAQREKERQKAQEALHQEQEAETERLAKLQSEVMEKRKQYKTSMVSSLEEALTELKALDREIRAIRDRYREELKNRILLIVREHSDNFGTVKLKKDEFETEAEYQARLAKNDVGKVGDNKTKYQAAMDTIRMEYEKQSAPLLAQMEEISKVAYTVYGHDGLKLALGAYNAERECFTITIASNNIKRQIHPYQHFMIVSKVGRQAQQLGIRTNDIIIRYNGRDVRPMSDWNLLWQTVIENHTTMEVDRDGKIFTLNLPKGKIGYENIIYDYMNDLKPDQFMVNGYLYVPRTEARQFKQDFLNGFITAEVKVAARTQNLCLVSSAKVVDESNDRRYDLFKSEYVNMGNRLTYDNANHIYWIAKSLHGLNFAGAEKFLKNYTFKGIAGWCLPTFNELASLRNPLATWRYGFHDHLYYTSTPYGRGQNHRKYNPATEEERNWGGDDDKLRVVGVAKNFHLPNYDIFEDRFFEIGNDLVFDAQNPLVWNMNLSEKQYTYLESERYVNQLNTGNTKGWRLPSRKEMDKLWDPAIPGIDSRYRSTMNHYYYTNTPIGSGQNHWQYNPAKGDERNWGGNDQLWVISVM